jgi:hypothetical protein
VYSVRKKVPEYRYPLYRSTGIRLKQVNLKRISRLDLQPVQQDFLAGAFLRHDRIVDRSMVES